MRRLGDEWGGGRRHRAPAALRAARRLRCAGGGALSALPFFLGYEGAARRPRVQGGGVGCFLGADEGAARRPRVQGGGLGADEGAARRPRVQGEGVCCFLGADEGAARRKNQGPWIGGR